MYEEVIVLFIRLVTGNCNVATAYKRRFSGSNKLNSMAQNNGSYANKHKECVLSGVSTMELDILKFAMQTSIARSRGIDAASVGRGEGGAGAVDTLSICYCIMYHMRYLAKYDSYLTKIVW